MQRAQRLEMVQNVVDDQERQRAEALSASQKRLGESETKLAELEAYHDSYVRGFAARAGTGIEAVLARDYHAFLAGRRPARSGSRSPGQTFPDRGSVRAGPAGTNRVRRARFARVGRERGAL